MRVDLLASFGSPVTILVGHFGSGKTEIAVNLAFGLQAQGRQVVLGDLDVVKPYFRCRLMRHDLAAKGIELIAPEGDRFYADLPIVVPQIRAAADRAARGAGTTILDVGGDDTGARVLGSLAGALPREAIDLLFVVNTNRPFAEDEAAIAAMLRDVEAAARLRVTGLIANTHLMDETTPADVRAGLAVARALSESTGVPVRCCAALDTVCAALARDGDLGVPLMPLTRHIVPPHVKRRPGSRRSLAV
jgi:hypothetical protein